jgi:hypothetical protein
MFVFSLLINCQTWYRDSHGLFDYEEDSSEKLTASEFRVNGSFNIRRIPKDQMTIEKFSNFNLMRLEQKYLEDLREEKSVSNYLLNKLINSKKEIVATIMHKEGNYWLYHKNTIEEEDQERGNPGDKIWHIVKYLKTDLEHQNEQGFQVSIGDTLKFGRVRYKIVMINNSKTGTVKYDVNDRFCRKSTRIGHNKPELLTENDNANISFGSSHS